MSCFTDLIGISPDLKGTIEPISKLYLTDLPFISIDTAKFAIDKENTTVQKLIEGRIKYAQEKVTQDFKKFIRPNFRLQDIITTDTIGIFDNDKIVKPKTIGDLKGIRIRCDKYPYSQLNLTSLSLFLTDTVSVPVKVIDLIEGREIDSFTIEAVAGQVVRTVINKEYITNRQKLHLLFAYDSGLSDAYSTLDYFNTDSDCLECGNKHYGYNNSNGFIDLSGATIKSTDPLIDNSIKGDANTYGMSIDYALTCSQESYLCSVRNQLAWPILHRSAMELLRYMKHSSELNSVIVLHSKSIDKLIADFQNEYEETMELTLDSMRFPAEDVCFPCNVNIVDVVGV